MSDSLPILVYNVQEVTKTKNYTYTFISFLDNNYIKLETLKNRKVCLSRDASVQLKRLFPYLRLKTRNFSVTLLMTGGNNRRIGGV